LENLLSLLFLSLNCLLEMNGQGGEVLPLLFRYSLPACVGNLCREFIEALLQFILYHHRLGLEGGNLLLECCLLLRESFIDFSALPAKDCPLLGQCDSYFLAQVRQGILWLYWLVGHGLPEILCFHKWMYVLQYICPYPLYHVASKYTAYVV